jgi:hypothetical protein
LATAVVAPAVILIYYYYNNKKKILSSIAVKSLNKESLGLLLYFLAIEPILGSVKAKESCRSYNWYGTLQ